jgi:hypothetical protein
MDTWLVLICLVVGKICAVDGPSAGSRGIRDPDLSRGDILRSMDYITKDSGKRYQQGDTGMVRDTDEGKPRFDLIIPEGIGYSETMLCRWAMLMTRGAEKYGERNWEKGAYPDAYHRARASALRHMLQWISGDTPEEDHSAAILFNVAAAEYYKAKGSRS